MIISTNEISGIFLLPLAVTHANVIWQVLNELGIIFIPFIIFVVHSFFEARTQGADEGSPAVLAIKLLEKSFWSAIIMFMILLTPIKSNFSVRHAQYSCSDNPALISNELSGSSSATNAALSALGARTDLSPPLLVGLMHQLSVGINETATSRLTCKQGVTAREVTEALSMQRPASESVKHSIINFNNRCLSIAKNELEKAMANKEPLRHDTTNRGHWGFYPAPHSIDGGLIRSAYQGLHITGKTLKEISMEVPNTWFDHDSKGKTLACDTLAESLYKKIESDLDSRIESKDELKKLYSFSRMSNANVTEAQIKHDMVIKVYESALQNEQSLEIKPSIMYNPQFVHAMRSIRPDIYKDEQFEVFDEKVSAKDESSSVMQRFGSAVVSIGAVVTSAIEGPKSHAVTIMLPQIVTIIQAILLISLPLIVVISGYSWRVTFSWFLLYFAVTLCVFWLNVGIQIETLLLSLVNYSDSLLSQMNTIKNGGDKEMYLVITIASTFVYMIPIIWVMLVQLIGNIGATSIATSISGAAVVGQVGAEKVIGVASDSARDLTKAVFDKKSSKDVTPPTDIGALTFLNSPNKRSP